MATLEERMARIEHENAELKRSVEILTTALGALVNKATLEKVDEKNSKIFDALMAHDQLTNQQLAELRGQLTETDGKIVGLQTEMRQEFEQQDGKIVGLQTEMRQGFVEQDGKIVGLQTQVHRLQNEMLGLRTEIVGLQAEILVLQNKMYQGFAKQDDKIVGLQTEMRQGFVEVKQEASAQFHRLEKLLVDRLPPPQ